MRICVNGTRVELIHWTVSTANEICGASYRDKEGVIRFAALDELLPSEVRAENIRQKLDSAPDPEIDENALTAAHLAVEDELADRRDRGMGVPGPRNGFVICDEDGAYSSVMRMGTRHGLRIAIEAYLKAVQ
jgi:hypothetical protein